MLRHAHKGFTLIEILTVVVVIGIAAALVVPHLGTSNDQSVAAAARIVMADLIYAQNQAITTQQTIYVQFNTATGTYALMSGPPVSPIPYLTNPITTSNYIETFGSGGSNGLSNSTLTSASFDSYTVLAFDELGTPMEYSASLNGGVPVAMTTGSIVLTSGTFSLTISIEAYTGALSVN
jgi:prepilin-type N-terminal cleavage/methylation domain-containing protein